MHSSAQMDNVFWADSLQSSMTVLIQKQISQSSTNYQQNLHQTDEETQPEQALENLVWTADVYLNPWKYMPDVCAANMTEDQIVMFP